MTEEQENTYWNLFFAVSGLGVSLALFIIAMNTFVPGWWATFWKWQGTIGEGFGVFMGAALGFGSLAWVSRLNHKQTLERDVAKRNHRRETLIRALGEEVRAVWHSNNVAIRLALRITRERRRLVIEGDIPDYDRSRMLGWTLRGRIFRATTTDDLGLLDERQIRALMSFYRFVDLAVINIENAETYEAFIGNFWNVRQVGKETGRAFGTNLLRITSRRTVYVNSTIARL